MGIAWSKVPYSLGEAAHWEPEQGGVFELLNRPDGPFFFAGDYLSNVGTWQESAMTSARRTVNLIDERRRATAGA